MSRPTNRALTPEFIEHIIQNVPSEMRYNISVPKMDHLR